MSLDRVRSTTAKLLAWLGIALILAPKINIIPIPGQTAGVRIDDVLLMLVLGFIWFAILGGFLRVNVFRIGYYQVILSFLISYLFARLLGWPANLLYVLRLLEYSTFIYLGFFFARSYSLSRGADVILVCNAIAMFLQYFGMWGGFTSDGYIADVGRLVGLTAGPWEIGYVLNVVLVIFLVNPKLSSEGLMPRVALIFLLILLTGSRAAALTFLLIVIVELYSRYNFTKMTIYLSFFSAVAVIFSLLFGDQLLQRSDKIFSFENIDYALDLFGRMEPTGTFSSDFFDDTSLVDGLDASWLIRSTHWAIALKEYVADPIFFLFGLGPGTFGPALDGSWVRIIVEGGLIGLLFYINFLRKLSFTVEGGGKLFLVTALNMVFIDIHISYKSMAILLFVLGYNLRGFGNDKR